MPSFGHTCLKRRHFLASAAMSAGPFLIANQLAQQATAKVKKPNLEKQEFN
jgi:phosphodiesterase/alkaline phosphatase D-like protein